MPARHRNSDSWNYWWNQLVWSLFCGETTHNSSMCLKSPLIWIPSVHRDGLTLECFPFVISFVLNRFLDKGTQKNSKMNNQSRSSSHFYEVCCLQ